MQDFDRANLLIARTRSCPSQQALSARSVPVKLGWPRRHHKTTSLYEVTRIQRYPTVAITVEGLFPCITAPLAQHMMIRHAQQMVSVMSTCQMTQPVKTGRGIFCLCRLRDRVSARSSEPFKINY